MKLLEHQKWAKKLKKVAGSQKNKLLEVASWLKKLSLEQEARK